MRTVLDTVAYAAAVGLLIAATWATIAASAATRAARRVLPRA